MAAAHGGEPRAAPRLAQSEWRLAPEPVRGVSDDLDPSTQWLRSTKLTHTAMPASADAVSLDNTSRACSRCALRARIAGIQTIATTSSGLVCPARS